MQRKTDPRGQLYIRLPTASTRTCASHKSKIGGDQALTLAGAIAGHGRYVRRARTAFFIAAGITLLVVAFLVVQQIADNNHGKVFGIQIGFQLDHQNGREM